MIKTEDVNKLEKLLLFAVASHDDLRVCVEYLQHEKLPFKLEKRLRRCFEVCTWDIFAVTSFVISQHSDRKQSVCKVLFWEKELRHVERHRLFLALLFSRAYRRLYT